MLDNQRVFIYNKSVKKRRANIKMDSDGQTLECEGLAFSHDGIFYVQLDVEKDSFVIQNADNSLTVDRKGVMSYFLNLAEDDESAFQLKLPMGALDGVCRRNECIHKDAENGFTVDLDYDLKLDKESDFSSHTIKIIAEFINE